MSSQETKKSAKEATMDDPGRTLTAEFLNVANSKDLVSRLLRILKCLREDETIKPDSHKYSGLPALCHALTRTVNHKDKKVRLYTVAACMELFTIYAPHSPWNQAETLDIFQQTIQLLANIQYSLSRNSYAEYFRILELLAEAKTAVLLVHLSIKNDNEEQQNDEFSSSSDASRSINKQALKVLAELFRTLLSSVRNRHPAELLEFCQKTLTACVEEFFESSTILPIPILDELLVCIGQGPKVLVLQQQQNKSKERKAAQQPPSLVYVKQKNPSYMVASEVLRASVDRLSTPIATLLNGLVNSDPRVIGASKISNHDFCTTNETGSSNNHHDSDAIPPHILELAQSLGKANVQQQEHSVNVYSVILELQRVAPDILTTIIGTLANHIETPDVSQRLLVVQTLGKLFTGDASLSSGGGNNDKAASNNHSKTTTTTFQQWLQRSADERLEIREIMLPHLLVLTKPQGNATELVSSQAEELATDVQEALVQRLTQESNSNFRTEVVEELCTLSYNYRKILTPKVMQQLGEQVLSEDKVERKNALTGLVQVYFKRFLRHVLGAVLEGGDNCPIETVLEVLSVSAAAAPSSQMVSSRTDESTDDVSYYQWIPGVLFESARYSDDIDSEMQSRVVQLVDELLLGSSSPHPNNRRKLTSKGRATGLVLVIDAIRDNPKAMHWMKKLMTMRSNLQTTLKEYLEARSDIQNHKEGSEEYFKADEYAMDWLEVVASMIPPPSGSSPEPGDRHPVLEKFHSIKDEDVFQILGKITNPAHSAKARALALVKLPNRVKDISNDDAISTWVKSLAKRCAMGDFINLDTIHHCVLLARECYHVGEFDVAHQFLVCVELAVDSFPSLRASDKVSENLTKLQNCITSSSWRSSARIEDIGKVLTALGSIHASVARYRELFVPKMAEEVRVQNCEGLHEYHRNFDGLNDQKIVSYTDVYHTNSATQMYLTDSVIEEYENTLEGKTDLTSPESDWSWKSDWSVPMNIVSTERCRESNSPESDYSWESDWVMTMDEDDQKGAAATDLESRRDYQDQPPVHVSDEDRKPSPKPKSNSLKFKKMLEDENVKMIKYVECPRCDYKVPVEKELASTTDYQEFWEWTKQPDRLNGKEMFRFKWNKPDCAVDDQRPDVFKKDKGVIRLREHFTAQHKHGKNRPYYFGRKRNRRPKVDGLVCPCPYSRGHEHPDHKQRYEIGTIVKKKFMDEFKGEVRFYEGKVIAFDRKEEYYLIKYEDGDSEEMDNCQMEEHATTVYGARI